MAREVYFEARTGFARVFFIRRFSLLPAKAETELFRVSTEMMPGIGLPYLVANILLSFGVAIFLSASVGRKFEFSPSWLGYPLGFIAGLFIGGGVWQLIKIVFVFMQMSSAFGVLGYEIDLLFYFILNSIIYAAVSWGIAAIVIVILWQRRLR